MMLPELGVNPTGGYIGWKYQEALARRASMLRVNIDLDTKVACVDADMCDVHVENGDSLSADLLVGADGIHSRVRQSLPELKTIAPTRADNYCYRIILPRAKMMSHPLTATLMQNPNQLCWTDI